MDGERRTYKETKRTAGGREDEEDRSSGDHRAGAGSREGAARLGQEENVTLLASTTSEGVGSLAVEGLKIGGCFETYLERALAAQSLKAPSGSSCWTKASLSAHKGSRVRQKIVEAEGCALLFTCRHTRWTSTP